jgi:hypothetical protein
MLKIDLKYLRRFTSWRVLAVNNTWALLPWAHAMYAGDRQWWNAYAEQVSFCGERWTRDPLSAQRHRLRLATWRDGTGLCKTPWHLHSGGNSGHQAINLAYHFGARRIVLLGFDMHRSDGGHWHGEHHGMLSAPNPHIAAWREMMLPLAQDLRDAGVDVVNATPGTALEAFPKRPLFEALR